MLLSGGRHRRAAVKLIRSRGVGRGWPGRGAWKGLAEVRAAFAAVAAERREGALAAFDDPILRKLLVEL